MISRIKELKEHAGFMRYFKNTSWLFAEKILRMAVGLFVGVWVARYLGPEQYGILSYAAAFVGLFIAIAKLGLDSIVVRELVNNENGAYDILGTAFWLRFFGALVLLFMLFIAVHFTSNDLNTNKIIFILAGATIFQSFNVVDLFFQSRVMSRYAVFANVIALFISSLIKIALILIEAPLIAFAWAALFDSFILGCGYIYFFLKYSNLHIKKFSFKKSTAFNLLYDSWPLIISGLVVALYMKIDQVMIKEMLGSEAVGQYAAAVRLSEAWYFIPMAICASLFPAIINAKKVSEELYYERLQKLYNLMVWIAAAIALPMTFLSDWIVKLLYGGQYNEAGGVLMIHIWAGIFVFLGVASGRWFVSENLQKYTFYRTVSGAIINIVLNLSLIPKYGVQGAAVATLISQGMATYLFDFFNLKTKHVFYMKTKALLFWGMFNVQKSR